MTAVAVTHEDIIEAVHDALDALSGVAIPWGIGDKERQRHRAPPAVIWTDAPSQTLARSVSGNPPLIASDVGKFSVTIWAEGADVIASRKAVRAIFDNLRVASRRAPEAGRSVRFGRYELKPDAYLNRGHILVTDVEIELGVADVATPVVILDQANTGGYVDDELIASGIQDLSP